MPASNWNGCIHHNYSGGLLGKGGPWERERCRAMPDAESKSDEPREKPYPPNHPRILRSARQAARAAQAARSMEALRAAVNRVPPLSAWLRSAGQLRCGWLGFSVGGRDVPIGDWRWTGSDGSTGMLPSLSTGHLVVRSRDSIEAAFTTGCPASVVMTRTCSRSPFENLMTITTRHKKPVSGGEKG